MPMFSRDNSCVMRAERRSGRLLSAKSTMVLMFQHATIKLCRHLVGECFIRSRLRLTSIWIPDYFDR